MNTGVVPAKTTRLTMPLWLQHAILVIATSLGTWLLSTYKDDGLRDERIFNNTIAIQTKVSKESYDQFQREVIGRLDRIEQKLDGERMRAR